MRCRYIYPVLGVHCLSWALTSSKEGYCYHHAPEKAAARKMQAARVLHCLCPDCGADHVARRTKS